MHAADSTRGLPACSSKTARLSYSSCCRRLISRSNRRVRGCARSCCASVTQCCAWAWPWRIWRATCLPWSHRCSSAPLSNQTLSVTATCALRSICGRRHCAALSVSGRPRRTLRHRIRLPSICPTSRAGRHRRPLRRSASRVWSRSTSCCWLPGSRYRRHRAPHRESRGAPWGCGRRRETRSKHFLAHRRLGELVDGRVAAFRRRA